MITFESRNYRKIFGWDKEINNHTDEGRKEEKNCFRIQTSWRGVVQQVEEIKLQRNLNLKLISRNVILQAIVCAVLRVEALLSTTKSGSVIWSIIGFTVFAEHRHRFKCLVSNRERYYLQCYFLRHVLNNYKTYCTVIRVMIDWNLSISRVRS